MDAFVEALSAYERRVAEDATRRIEFIRDIVARAGASGAVVGISGGLDSAVVAALLVRALGTSRTVGLWMPIASSAMHAEHARLLASTLDLKLLEIDLGAAFEAFAAAMSPHAPLDELSLGNTKARLRMTALYALANAEGLLVSDTTNRSEAYVGYVTKGGDAVADFNPLASLTKSEVRILGAYLGVPQAIVHKPPSADLWPGQTDEAELGVTYEALDRYLLTGEASPEVRARIERLHEASRHKREAMPAI
ncbi:MAG: NAD(+) synthase [Hydrogenibacillus sp.]|nr:NAD(+) synthase [Hydrogenibacillus sp.]